MSEEKTIEEMDEQKLPRTPVPDFYVNSSNFVISPFDVQINFGVESGADRSSEDVAIIRMSPLNVL